MNNNPFRYGKVVTTPYFTGRINEIEEITATLQAGNNVILSGPRRYGKTSLIKEVLKNINSPNTVYLDFYSLLSQKDFIGKYADAILKTQKIPVKKMMKKISGLLTHISPSVSFDVMGNPSWSLNFNEQTSVEQTLLAVLDLPQHMINKNDRFYVVFDEFQEIGKLNGDSFEKQLRSVIQNHNNVSYIFLGSKTHLLLEMFKSESRALFNAAKLVTLNKIGFETMREFIISRFETTGNKITKDLACQIIEKTHNIPYYVQYLAAQVWQLINLSQNVAAEQLIESAIENILTNQNDYYFLIYDNLTVYQRAVLHAIAQEQANIFSTDYHQRHHLTSQSSTQRAIQSLVEKGVLEKAEHHFSFSDPFFYHWIQLRMGA
jgi:uncharacterized protein